MRVLGCVGSFDYVCPRGGGFLTLSESFSMFVVRAVLAHVMDLIELLSWTLRSACWVAAALRKSLVVARSLSRGLIEP